MREIEVRESMINQIRSLMEIIFVVLHMAGQGARDFIGSIIKNFLLKMGCLTFVGIISVLRIVRFF